MTDFVDAEDAILKQLKVLWDVEAQPLTPAPTYLPHLVFEALEVDLKPHPRDGKLAWARAVVRHNDAKIASLANNAGARRRRRYGLVWVQVFTPTKSKVNYTLVARLAQVALKAYEGQRAANGSVVFTRAAIEDKNIDGNWYRKDVKATFYWDEVR